MTTLAVTGLGALTPLAGDPQGLVTALDEGRSALARIPDEDLPCRGRQPIGRWAARIEALDTSAYLTPARARRLDRASRMAVAATAQARAAAGLDGADAETALIVGTCSAGSSPLTAFLSTLFTRSPEAAPPFEFPNTVANAPAGHTSIQLALTGPNLTLSQSEAVMGPALVHGRLLLASGRCRRLLVGAVDEWEPAFQLGYSQLGALRDGPTGGGGMLLGEGAAMLHAERPETAAARDARILATITGVACGGGRGEPYRWIADAERLGEVIAAALADAGREPGEIGSVVLAANGVEAMERAEAAALASLFAGRTLAATGIKGALGERAVSGAAGVVVAVVARHRRRLPPFAGGALARWPAPVAPLAAPAALPEGATLVVLYGSGGNFAAVVVE